MNRFAIASMLAGLAVSGCHMGTGPGPMAGGYRPAPPPVYAPPPPVYAPAPPPAYAPPPPVYAPPPGYAGAPRYDDDDDDDDDDEWRAGGPPPWAPAHGYRRKKERGNYYAYQAPYGVYYNTCYREDLGQALGAIAGGVAGYQVGKGGGKAAAVIGGTIIGALIGGHIGRSMDAIDQNCIGQILEHAPPNQPVIWQNPQAGGQYQVTPSPVYNDRQGRYCREYQTVATIGGQQQQAYGTACRQPDGSWQVVN